MSRLGSFVSGQRKVARPVVEGPEGDRRAVPHLWLCDRVWALVGELEGQDALDLHRETDVSAGRLGQWRSD